MTTHTLSLGSLVLLGTQQGPYIHVTIDGCDGHISMTLAQWTGLQVVADVLGAADREMERLRRERDEWQRQYTMEHARRVEAEKEAAWRIDNETRAAKERDEAIDAARRAWQDRYDALGVKTTEGLTASEWLLRTGVAERERDSARADAAAAKAKSDELAAALKTMAQANALLMMERDAARQECRELTEQLAHVAKERGR